MTRYLSVCSGLEGASLAFQPLGWTAAGFAEIDPFAAALLAERYGSNLPGERLSHNAPPNFGDFTTMDLSAVGAVDVLVGGTPCQAFSIAGKRLSLADARGNLSLAYAVLAHELARSHGLRNALWENVPGVLNTPDNAFGCFLGSLVGSERAIPGPKGRGWPDAGMVDGPRGRAAWRLLDAQYFGLAQRRERVFVVADFGDGADPAAVLFEPASLRGNSAPRRETGEGIAGDVAPRAGGGGVAKPILTGGHSNNPLDENLIAHSLRAEGFDASEDGTGRGTPIVPVAYRTSPNCGAWETGERIDALTTGTDRTQHLVIQSAVAFDLRGREGGAQFEGPHDTANIRAANGGSTRSYVAERLAVRRLIPVECERLQGVPDGHTRIAWRGKGAEACPDGPRYKALGNSWAVPVVAWIGARMDAGLRGRA